MQAGVDKWEAAGFLGMSVETLDRVYGHHHPAHLRAAAHAIGYRRRKQSLAGDRVRCRVPSQHIEVSWPETVSTFAGHSRLAVTMDRYGHLFKTDGHKKAMDAIERELLR
jgi:hypothetical protein